MYYFLGLNREKMRFISVVLSKKAIVEGDISWDYQEIVGLGPENAP
jgi:hypothetical protein